jgi:uncharacterized protein
VTSGPDSENVSIRCGIKIPTRDGMLLDATAYLPARQPAPAPCIVAVTPYTSDGWHLFGVYFAARGMPFVTVDARGRGDSAGLFPAGARAGEDGHDVVEWLGSQPFCNGKVGMYGASDLGLVQWATAKELPKHLATIVPTASPCLGVDFPMRNNVSYPYLVQWLVLTAGRTRQGRLAGDEEFWLRHLRRWHDSGRPFRELDSMVGHPSPVFQEWLAHPEPDAYWDEYNPTDDEYARLRIPILTITGAYDDDQPGALEHYRRHNANSIQGERPQHFLIIGPWNHGATQWPTPEFGGLHFGPESVLDIRELHLEWYRWTLLAAPRPRFLQKPVAYYVSGAERWRYADTLDAVTAHHEPLFLDSAGRADDVFSSGWLASTIGTGPPDTYTFDPRDSSGVEIEAATGADGRSLIDQRLTCVLRGHQAIYHSAPFEKDVEISGFFRLSVWIAIDCPDTDFYVSVHEIELSGRSVRLSTDVMRARYREGLRKSRLITTPEPLRYEFERFTFISRRIRRGHCLRLAIAPVGRLIEGLFVQKNYNAGGVVSDESSRDGRAITVKVFHDRSRPSVLQVPLGRAQE